MKSLIMFADGFEECEGLIVVDILRRASIDIDMISISDNISVTGSHNIKVECDGLLNKIDTDQYDLIILPGGIPGTYNLRDDETVTETILKFNEKNKKIAAICAAPSILAGLGILKGRQAVAHKNFIDKLADAEVVHKEVVVDGNITTAWGLGAAIPFALSLVEQLKGKEAADDICESIGYYH